MKAHREWTCLWNGEMPSEIGAEGSGDRVGSEAGKRGQAFECQAEGMGLSEEPLILLPACMS